MCPLKDLKSSFGALKEGAYSYEKNVLVLCEDRRQGKHRNNELVHLNLL